MSQLGPAPTTRRRSSGGMAMSTPVRGSRRATTGPRWPAGPEIVQLSSKVSMCRVVAARDGEERGSGRVLLSAAPRLPPMQRARPSVGGGGGGEIDVGRGALLRIHVALDEGAELGDGLDDIALGRAAHLQIGLLRGGVGRLLGAGVGHAEEGLGDV